jgi:subtilase family serine protease
VALAAGPPGQIVVPPSSVVKPEDRGGRAHTNILLMVPTGGFPASAGTPKTVPVLDWLFETPASLACAYRLVAVANGCNPYLVSTNPKGGSHAIAVVEAFDYSDAHGVAAAAHDLAVFDTVLGLPTANFSVIFGTGSPSAGCRNGSKPPPAQNGWDVEAALDIEWAHAMAPSAKLYLVEANSNSSGDLLNAVGVATKCVQMGWGFNKFSGENAFDSTFSGQNASILPRSAI